MTTNTEGITEKIDKFKHDLKKLLQVKNTSKMHRKLILKLKWHISTYYAVYGTDIGLITLITEELLQINKRITTSRSRKIWAVDMKKLF